MKPHVCVLLVHDNDFPLEELSRSLRVLGVNPCRARSCAEADHLIRELEPDVVFSDTGLCDGTWQRVVNLADRAPQAVNVVVVGKHDDMELYLSALEHGAHDFVAPPFESEGLWHILRCAVENTSVRRGALSRAAAS